VQQPTPPLQIPGLLLPPPTLMMVDKYRTGRLGGSNQRNNESIDSLPNKRADTYNSVLLDGLKNAWNILVAPRYSSASNFEFKPIQSWQSIEFAEADMIENATGKAFM